MTGIAGGSLRTTVLAEALELRIMRDRPQLLGRRARYVTAFHFTGGKPPQIFFESDLGLGVNSETLSLGGDDRLAGCLCAR